MTTSTEARLERAAREAIYGSGFGLGNFEPLGPVVDGEPLTLSDGDTTVTVEIKVHNVTGWEHEQ